MGKTSENEELEKSTNIIAMSELDVEKGTRGPPGFTKKMEGQLMCLAI